MWCPRDRNSEVDGPGLLSTRSFHCDACPCGPWHWRREEGGVSLLRLSLLPGKPTLSPKSRVSPPGAAGHNVATGHRQAGRGPRATGASSGRQEASRDSSPGPGEWAHVSSTHHNVGVLAGKQWGCCWAANEQGYSGPSEGPSREPRVPSPTAAPTRSSPFAERPLTPLPCQHFASERFCPRPLFSLLGTCLDVWARVSLSTRS